MRTQPRCFDETPAWVRADPFQADPFLAHPCLEVPCRGPPCRGPPCRGPPCQGPWDRGQGLSLPVGPWALALGRPWHQEVGHSSETICEIKPSRPSEGRSHAAHSECSALAPELRTSPQEPAGRERHSLMTVQGRKTSLQLGHCWGIVPSQDPQTCAPQIAVVNRDESPTGFLL